MKPSKQTGAARGTTGYEKPMKRTDVTELVVMAKIRRGLTWPKIAKAVGQSKEWTTAALLGQMQMTKQQAQAAGRLLGLPTRSSIVSTNWSAFTARRSRNWSMKNSATAS